MRVHIDRDFDFFFELCDQVEAFLGTHDAGHVLDTQALAAHFLDLLAEADIHLQIVDRRQGVANGPLCMAARLEALVHRGLDVAQVVERVENADDIHAVLNGCAHKTAHHVIRIVAVPQQVLAAKQHLQLGVFHVLPDCAQALPRVFPEITQAGVKGRTSPALDRMITGLVDGVQDAGEILNRQAGRHQRLVGVAQDGFRNMNFHSCSLPFYSTKNFAKWP